MRSNCQTIRFLRLVATGCFVALTIDSALPQARLLGAEVDAAKMESDPNLTTAYALLTLAYCDASPGK